MAGILAVLIPVLISLVQYAAKFAVRAVLLAGLAYALWKWGIRIETAGLQWLLNQFGGSWAFGYGSVDLPDIWTWLSAHNFVSAFSAADKWIPLHEALLGFGVYCHLLLLLTPIKLVLRRIPFING